jgi:hypothetical protein
VTGPASPGDSADSALTALRSHVGNLAVALPIWQARDDGKPDAPARRAASGAVDAIDAALAGLHAIRARLITEIRASDDATAIRVDELLAESERSNSGPSGPENTEARGTEDTPGQREGEADA